MLKYQNSFMRVYDFTDIGFGETVVMFRHVQGEEPCVKICSNISYDPRAFNLEMTLSYNSEKNMFDNIDKFNEDFLREFLVELMSDIQQAILSNKDINVTYDTSGKSNQ